MSLESVRKRLAAATPGPWQSNISYHVDGDDEVVKHITAGTDDNTVAVMGCDFTSSDADADLIAHAPTDLRLALAVVEAARDLVDDLQYTARSEQDGSWWPSEPHPDSCQAMILRALGAFEAAP